MRPLIFVVGTRPEALKIGPVVAECKHRGLPHEVWHTGQHQELFTQTGLIPDRVLDLPSDEDGMEAGLRQAFLGLVEGRVVVQGDTRSALAATTAAHLVGFLPIYHIEAGVRTGDFQNPYPEEGYRVRIDIMAHAGACATLGNQENIRRHMDWPDLPTRFPVTGNPGIDALYARQQPIPYAERCQGTVLVTLHRRESWGGPMVEILTGIERTTRWPVVITHPNGEVAKAVAVVDGEIGTHPPMPPLAFSQYLAGCGVVVTDSGGVQEEAAALGIPCVVARDVTDRPESVASGQAIVAGRTKEGVADALRRALDGELSREPSHVFGKGNAAIHIVNHCETILR